MFSGKLIPYFFLVFVGFLLILLVSIILETPSTPKGEYHYSSFLSNNYGITAGILYFIAGLAVGYLMELKPWLVGICLILIFPLTSLYEGTIYRGSHNLIPFEFLLFLLYSLPSMVGAYLGKWFSDRARKNN
jgi:hypothetical protein